MDGLLDSIIGLPQAVPWLRLDLLAKLLLATLLGGAVGWERERSRKPAGLRTNVLICVGAALIADLSVSAAALADGPADPARIAAQIVTGVGFLGAGTIIQERGGVTGLTTAATLWVVAGIGMAVGLGAVAEAVGATFVVLIVLIPLQRLEAKASGNDEGGNPIRTDSA
ncbi:MAG TPA: MgtC/SapB family protein [Longimicrobiales bacterium]|nr:MgtC/SapB family protein [Longimicrobiales bacterium]